MGRERFSPLGGGFVLSPTRFILFSLPKKMGFDVVISSFCVKNGKAYKQTEQEETYLSFNWGDLSNICVEHFLEEGKCQCEQPHHLWYFRDDCHSRRGDDVCDRAQKALDLLAKHGVLPGRPDLDWDWDWGWRIRGGALMSPKERLEVFANHLKHFRDLGIKYHACVFVGDCDEGHDLIMPDGTTIPWASDDTAVVADDVDAPVTYFRHPYKGNFKVNSFKTAMEVFGLMSAQDDPRADQWFSLAMEMPDTPWEQK